MSAPNPYAAPQAAPAPAPGGLQSAYGHTYVPLAWRTTLATLAVIALTLASFALHALQLSFGDRLKVATDLGPLLLVGVAALGVLFSILGAAVFFFIWIHRASSNLKGLGRVGMRNTPGWCVGGYFVPILQLFQPMQSMKEIWQASDPTAVQGTWFASSSTPLVGIWWAAWLLSGVIGVFAFFVRGDPSSEGGIGLASDLALAIAAVGLVMLMRGVASRQEQAAAALRTGAAT